MILVISDQSDLILEKLNSNSI